MKTLTVVYLLMLVYVTAKDVNFNFGKFTQVSQAIHFPHKINLINLIIIYQNQNLISAEKIRHSELLTYVLAAPAFVSDDSSFSYCGFKIR